MSVPSFHAITKAQIHEKQGLKLKLKLKLKLAMIFIGLVLITTIVLLYFWRQQKSRPLYNLVLITIDTLRFDYLGCYGYGSSELYARDLRNCSSLAEKLANPQGDLARYLSGKLSPETRDLLQTKHNGDSHLFARLLKDLNRIIGEEEIYDARRFAGVNFSKATQELLRDKSLQGSVRHLNRMLLADAYPAHIVPVYRPQTHNIDKLAHGGTLCSHAYAQVPLTFPSHSSILTGTSPDFHGIRDNNWYRLPNIPTMATILKSYGYRTAAVVSSATVSRAKGLDMGFDEYDEVIDTVSKDMTGHILERNAGESVHLAMEQLRRCHETPNKPFFLWLHLFDPHAEYTPPSPFREDFSQDLYYGEVAYTDYCLGKFLEQLQNLFGANTLVVFTADHGEGLGEHGEQSHGYFLYHSTLHIPLIFWCPSRVLAGNRISAPVRSIDIMPTTLSLLGVENHGKSQGYDFSSLLSGSQTGRTIPSNLPVYAETYFPYHAFGWRVLKSIRVGDYKYVATRKGHLYFLPDDPHEIHNLLQGSPAPAYVKKAQELREILLRVARENVAATPLEISQDQNTNASLGYSSYPSLEGPGDWDDAMSDDSTPVQGDAYKTLPDPLDMVDVLHMFVQAQSLLWQSRDAESIELFREILKRDPCNASSYALLGKLYVRQNRLAEAEEIFRKFYFELRPHLKIARNALIDALIVQQKHREALQLAGQTYLFRLDQKSQNDLQGGVSENLRKRFAQRKHPLSIRATVKTEEPNRVWSIMDDPQRYSVIKASDNYLVFALKRDETDATLLSILAYLKLEDREFVEAAQRAMEASLLDPHLAGAPFYLGRALWEQGKYEEAAIAFENAIILRAQWPEACYWYGLCQWQSGNVAVAQNTWEKLVAMAKEDPLSWLYYGKALLEQKKIPPAISALEKAVQLCPNSPEAYYYCGLAHLQMGNIPSARLIFAKLPDMGSHPLVYFYRGKALYAQQDFVQAICCFQESLKIREDWKEAIYYYGISLWQMENKRSARLIWDKILPKLSEQDPMKKDILRLLNSNY